MKKSILLIFMIVVCSATNAQKATRSISIEGLGAQNMLGINYDARIKGDIGYRYQRPSGFMFRAGISPSFNFGDKHGVSKNWCYPYIGLGWSF